MINTKKNEMHQELIIKSPFPASQVPAGLLLAGAVAMVPLQAEPCCFYSKPANWDQMVG